MIEDKNIVLFVSTFPPRECGIATFTENLSRVIERKFFPYLETKILAMNSNSVNIYNYPKKVIYQLGDSEKKKYEELAEKISKNNSIKLVIIQHEFGIFGGSIGEYLIDFLKNLKKSKVIKFHSILSSPDQKRRRVVRQIAENVDEIIVMTAKGIEILEKEYGLKTPIRVIPHGIPNVEYETQEKSKKALGLSGKIVLSSFGMVSQNKGYEYVIEALPELVRRYPNLIYIMIGVTHPNIRRQEGEKYRNHLARRVKQLGLQKNVKFYNKYVSSDEIIQYLKASDLYICSSLTPEQITSGTLAYAMGCGRTVISTPFLHAKDLITEETGILVSSFRSSKEFEKALLEILPDKKRMKNIEQTSYELTRHMTWSNVALAYGDIIKRYVQVPETFFEILPEINTKHLTKMTNDFGILQFAHYTTPNPKSGYTLDDNARALVVASKLFIKTNDQKYLSLLQIYLKYLEYVQGDDGRFFNLVSKDKITNKNSWSDEAHARAIQSLGLLLNLQSIPRPIKRQAENLFLKSLLVAFDIDSPRSISSIIKGLYFYNKEFYSEKIIKKIYQFANRLLFLYEKNSDQKWEWFEKELTYTNSKLSEALLYAYIVTRERKYLNIATRSVNFLISKTFENSLFIPIGQNGWFKKGMERAYYDQQPIEAASMVNTLALAYKITRNPEYEKKALCAFQWFLGRNTLKQVIYDEKTGGCFDGLDKNAANLNQGAESTLAYLSARLAMDDFV